MNYRFSATVSAGSFHRSLKGNAVGCRAVHDAIYVASKLIEEHSLEDADKITLTVSLIRPRKRKSKPA